MLLKKVVVRYFLLFILSLPFSFGFSNHNLLSPYERVLINSEIVLKAQIIDGFEYFALIQPIKIYSGTIDQTAIWIHTDPSEYRNRKFEIGDTCIFFLSPPYNPDRIEYPIFDDTTVAQVQPPPSHISYSTEHSSGNGIRQQNINNGQVFYDLTLNWEYGNNYKPQFHPLAEYELFLEAYYGEKANPLFNQEIIARLNRATDTADIVHDINMLYLMGYSNYEPLFDHLKNREEYTIHVALASIMKNIEEPKAYRHLNTYLYDNHPAVISRTLFILGKKTPQFACPILVDLVDTDKNGILTEDEIKSKEETQGLYKNTYSFARYTNCIHRSQIVSTALIMLTDLGYENFTELVDQLAHSDNVNILNLVIEKTYDSNSADAVSIYERFLHDPAKSRDDIYQLYDVSYPYSDSVHALFANYISENLKADYLDAVITEKLPDLKSHFLTVLYSESKKDEYYYDWLEEMIDLLFFQYVEDVKKDLYNSLYPINGLSYHYVQDTTLLRKKIAAENDFYSKYSSILDTTGKAFLCHALLDTIKYTKTGEVSFDFMTIFYLDYDWKDYDSDATRITEKKFLNQKQMEYAQLLGLSAENVGISRFFLRGKRLATMERGTNIISPYLAAYGKQEDIDFLLNLKHQYYAGNEKNWHLDEVIQEIKELRLK